MSEIAAPTLTPAAVPHPRVIALSRVRRIGYVVLGLQLIGFMTWSAIVFNRYALTFDYAVYHQGWYQIAHGNLDPYDSPQQCAFWQIHGELIFWPLALLYWVWPHDLMLLWIQDFAVVASEAVAFTWICEIAGRRRADGRAALLAVVGLVLLVANTWIWQVVAWDYHTEPVLVALLIPLIRDLANNRRRALAWVPPLLLCGDVAATYLIGVGLGTVLANRKSRVRGLLVAGAGALSFIIIDLVHANLGSGHGLTTYAYLAGEPAGATLGIGALITGILTHPWIVVRIMAAKAADIWANLAPSGLLGACYVPLMPIAIIVLLESHLSPGLLFAEPGLQNHALYIIVPVGTVAILAWLRQRHQITALVLACLVAAQALTWAAVFMPKVPGEWLRVPAGAVSTLSAVQPMIPPDAEVIASQGISGRFSNRTNIFPIMGAGSIPVHGETWFIIAPIAGIEIESTAAAMAFIGQLAGPLRATLVTQANGVWVFRWKPPAGTTAINLPSGSTPIPAWASAGAAGRPDLAGPAVTWRAAATGAEGYVADQLEWRVPTGRYVADVRLATSGPVNVEVWNDTGSPAVLLTRRTVLPSGGALQVTVPVDARTAYHDDLFSGLGPFHAEFNAPPPGQRLEVRVWSPGNTQVDVYGAVLIPAGSSVIP
jgi:predicted membrane protein DUF2079